MKKREIIVLSLVLIIIAAGVFQYSYNKDIKTVNNSEEIDDRLGEAVFVDSNINTGTNQAISLDDKSKDEKNKNDKNDKNDEKDEKDEKDKTNKEEDVNSVIANTDYFAKARLGREKTRDKIKEDLNVISQDDNADKKTRDEAYEEMIKLADFTEKEMKIEALIKQKGFMDVIAFFSDDGSIDVIVKANSLSQAQVAQLSDITGRHGNIQMELIHIKNIY